MSPSRFSTLSSVFLFLLSFPVCAQQQWRFYNAGLFAEHLEINGNEVWVGTNHGVVRVNAQTYAPEPFTSFNSGLTAHYNAGLGVGAAGQVWIPHQIDGISRHNPDNSWTNFSSADFPDSLHSISSATVSPQGVIWAHGFFKTPYSPHIARIENGIMTTIPLPPGFKYPAWQLRTDVNGGLWAALVKDNSGIQTSFICRYHNGLWTVYEPTQFEAYNNTSFFTVGAFYPGTDGSMFAWTYAESTPGIRNKLFKIKDGQITKYPVPYQSAFESADIFSWLYVDSENIPWIGSSDNRVLRWLVSDIWDETKLDTLGLPAAGGGNAFRQDPQGRWWLLVNGRVFHTDGHSDAQEIPLFDTEFPAEYAIWGLTNTPDGDTWMGGQDALYRYDGAQWQQIPMPPSTGDDYRYATHTAPGSDNQVWYLPFSYSGLVRYDEQQFAYYFLNKPNATFEGYELRSALAVDAPGNAWVATGTKDVLRVTPTAPAGFSITYFSLDINQNDSIFQVAVDSQGVVWAVGRNIYKVNGDSLQLVASNDLKRAWSMVGTDNGVWFADTEGRIYRFDGAQLFSYDELLSYPTGLNDGHYPEISLDAQGNLWVGTFSNIGLLRRNPAGVWDRFTVDNSPLTGNFVQLPRVDACGNVWFSVRDELGVFNENGFQADCIVKVHEPIASESVASPFEVFPNPARSGVVIRPKDSDDTIQRVLLHDVSGKTRMDVLHNNGSAGLELQLGNLSPGVYFASILSEGSWHVVRVLKLE